MANRTSHWRFFNSDLGDKQLYHTTLRRPVYEFIKAKPNVTKRDIVDFLIGFYELHDCEENRSAMLSLIRCTIRQMKGEGILQATSVTIPRGYKKPGMVDHYNVIL